MEKVYARLDAGEESETPGLLEQWLREGKISPEQAVREGMTMFTAGVDTVCAITEGFRFLDDTSWACARF